MKITTIQRAMLVRFGAFARNREFFTHCVNGFQALAPSVAQRNIDELEQLDFISQTKTGFKLTQAGRNWIDGPGRVTGTPRITNASSVAPYIPKAWVVRAGGDDHLQYASLDMGPQIERVGV